MYVSLLLNLGERYVSGSYCADSGREPCCMQGLRFQILFLGVFGFTRGSGALHLKARTIQGFGV